jgi:hypothetical protein
MIIFIFLQATKHSCPYCTQICSTPSGVKRHIIYRHTDIKYFQCPDCSLSYLFLLCLFFRIKKKNYFSSFKCANSLTVHRRRLHLLPLLDKINDDDDKPQTSSNSKEKEKVKRIFCFSNSTTYI